MKKICLTLLAVVCAGMLFTGCSKDKTVTNEVNNAFTKFVGVTPSDWQISSDGNYFEFDVDATDVPNNFIFNSDGVLVFVGDTNDDNGDGAYYPLSSNRSLDGFVFDYYLKNNTVILNAKPANGSKPSNASKPDINFYFNIIFIQPQDYSAASSIKNDYDAVKATFHLRN